MRWPQSLQGRLSLWLGLGLLLAWSLAAAMTAHRLRGEMDVVFDSAL
ncbi:two-component sensor histidine kinase, partial [Escherichia coli]